ncbi:MULTISPECIES: hypothetical protein [unclassified Oceanobacillus]|uniref:hypothetical protein n=1 Tax=unclassified Oceanobacillus TaxID=2630292 RepID=UPI001BE7693F|nr:MULTISPECIES: hypothetical protein [unclassified Oceanobacillus]MBT2601252.1 hypothetical protein [Oceanobacillus sp. ISL-74]MBT2653642.1 hypothetical protein [Oceanobacillus sp. ISL-73]
MKKMKFEDHFREKDIPKAKNEFSCMADLAMLINSNAQSGNFDKALERGEDLIKSLERFVHLNERKQADDSYQALIDDLVKRGIKAETVRMHFEEKAI